jgi:glycosyltransferase involved in cell wall biosynthesis
MSQPNPTLSPVAVILPSFNEEGAVASQVRAIRRALHERGLIHEILVVDDGSSHRTAEEALDGGFHTRHMAYGHPRDAGMPA